MYANGRNLRLAILQDVENCEGSWDAETIRALMGCDCLYVLRECRVVDICSDESVPPASDESVQPVSDESVSPASTAVGISDGEHEINDNSDFLFKSTFEANLQSHNEMLDTLPQEDVRKSLLNYGVSEAVDYLINQVEAINSTVSTARHERSQVSICCGSSATVFDDNVVYNEPPSLQSLLQAH